MDSMRFELESEALPGVVFGFSVPFDVDGGQDAFWPAEEAMVVSLSESLAKAATTARRTMAVGARYSDSVTVTSVRIEGDPFDMLRFEVPTATGRVSKVLAPDYARATLAAAAKFAFEGRAFNDILNSDAPALASALGAASSKDARHPKAPAYCEFQLADWRVAEMAADDLSEAQREAMTFSLLRNAYGPEAVLRHGDDEYAFLIEIDRGAVVVRASPPQDDNIRADIRLARDSAQVQMTAGDKVSAFDLSGHGIQSGSDAPLSQGDDEKVQAPAT
ncbi:MAG: hypothetical protein EOR63_32230 [Mesorhizobium sp.]|nr:MAG: hypothetical protein EOR63_32230 [Mesorhizobium sp.]